MTGPEASPPEQSGGYLFLRRPINELVHTSDAAAIATVESVGHGRWNSTDDEAFATNDASGVHPFRYRDATFVARRVLWSSDRLALTEGERIIVRLYGDGSASGGWAGGIPMNQISGQVETGSDVLVLLRRGPFYVKDGDRKVTLEVVQIVENYQGNWAVHNEQAVSIDAARTVPLERLIARLQHERSRGPQPQDQRGARNPLEQ